MPHPPIGSESATDSLLVGVGVEGRGLVKITYRFNDELAVLWGGKQMQ